MGQVSIIQKGVHFGTGENIEIGNFSGIGKNALIPSNIIIGEYVMIAQDLFIIANNHKFDRIDTPMLLQGYSERKQVIIEDDVWIGARVIINPGIRIGRGSIIAAGAVVTRNVNSYSLMGGVPAHEISNRRV